jgi:transcription initiation factor TFIIH subunit 4
MPGMTSGEITRDSVNAAFRLGITAEQLINYLRAHMHIQMSGGDIPSAVTKQVEVWEKERKRVTFDSGMVYNTFSRLEQFEAMVHEAKRLELYVWATGITDDFTGNEILCVEKDGHDQMKAFWKTIKHKTDW